MTGIKQEPGHGTASHGWTLFILAGGKSQRMGRDKSRIRINGVSLLTRVKQVAVSCGQPVKTIRTDAITNCGPLSGLYTGLSRARTRWCLFLGCDMPLISRLTLTEIMAETERLARPVFTETEHGFGFPLTLGPEHASVIQLLIGSGRRSVFSAAERVNPAAFKLPENRRHEHFNANTPEELRQLAGILSRRDA